MARQIDFTPSTDTASRPQLTKKVSDALADLNDYVTNPELGSTGTGLAGEALAAVEKCLHEGDRNYARKAVAMLNRLTERYIEDPNCGDVPANHTETNGPTYPEVIATLRQEIESRFRNEFVSRRGRE